MPFVVYRADKQLCLRWTFLSILQASKTCWLHLQHHRENSAPFCMFWNRHCLLQLAGFSPPFYCCLVRPIISANCQYAPLADEHIESFLCISPPLVVPCVLAPVLRARVIQTRIKWGSIATLAKNLSRNKYFYFSYLVLPFLITPRIRDSSSPSTVAVLSQV